MVFGYKLLGLKSWEKNRNSSRVFRLILNVGRWINVSEGFFFWRWNSVIIIVIMYIWEIWGYIENIKY